MQRKYLQVEFKVKEISEEGVFEGYGSVFGNKDLGGDVVVKGAFAKSLAKKLPALLWQHGHKDVPGVYLEAGEDDHGLFLKGKLANTQLGKEAHELMKMGAITGLSIGYSVLDADYDKETGTYYIKEVDLWEVSLVTFPMNQEARISAVKDLQDILASGGTPSVREFEAFLKDSGFSQKQSKAIVAEGFRAINDNESSRRDAVEQAEIKTSLCNLRKALTGKKENGRD